MLRLIINEPILMLSGDDEGYGSRWTIGGQQVQPAIARYLMESGFVAEIGQTEFGARKLALTPSGNQFRKKACTGGRAEPFAKITGHPVRLNANRNTFSRHFAGSANRQHVFWLQAWLTDAVACRDVCPLP